MRHVLVDYAREHNAQRRSGNLKQVSLDQAAYISINQSAELVSLDDMLAELEKFDPLQSQIVERKFRLVIITALSSIILTPTFVTSIY